MENMEVPEENTDNEIGNTRLEHEWVQVLINLRMKYARSFTGKRHSATTAWDEILREMKDLGAPKSITRIKIKKKWMNLIAKYKQLKLDPDSKKRSTWPYFDQIDRAHTRNRGGNKHTKDTEADTSGLLSNSNKYTEKEKFMRTLIDLRYKYRYLFTGKKYAAQKGWMVIQNYLPSGEKYSVDQIRKVWHNLVQRYKTVTENETDHSKITWIYFQQLHKIMMLKDSSNEGASTSSIEFVEESTNVNSLPAASDEDQNPFENITTDRCSEVKPFLIDDPDVKAEYSNSEHRVEDSEKNLPTSNINIVADHNSLLRAENECNTTTLDDILHYLKERDKKRDEQFKELLGVMKEILSNLKQ